MSLQLLKIVAMLSQLLLYAGIIQQIRLNFTLGSTAAISPSRWILRAIPNAILALYGVGQMHLDLFVVGNTGAVAVLCCVLLLQLMVYPPRRTLFVRLSVIATLLSVLGALILVLLGNSLVAEPSAFLNASPLMAILIFIVPGQFRQIWLNTTLSSLCGLSLFECSMTTFNYIIWGCYLALSEGTTAAIACGIGAITSSIICVQILRRMATKKISV